MKVINIASSCVIIETTSKKILCDPWLFDGEYYGSWYHYPKLEIKDYYFSDIDYIYISHIHPDHLSKKSLKFLDKNIPVIINSYSTKFLKRNIELLGFNVIELEDNKRMKLSENEYITIFSADNCDPELCLKFFGCGKVENVLGSTQIDSYCLIEDNDYKLLNLNDCPFDLAQNSLKKNIIDNYKIDFLLVGYAGAGPYPQCFELSDNEKIKEANLKQNKFLNQSINFIELINPNYFMPFAGTYILGGSLADLNHTRGVPEISDAFCYIEEQLKKGNSTTRGVLLNSYKSFNLLKPETEKYIKIDKDEKLKYLSKISKNLFDYQKEDYPDKTELKNLLFEAYEKFNNKRKELNVSSKTRIAINLYDLYAVFDFKGGKVNFLPKDNIIGEENIIIYRLDERLLYNILRGPRYAHWNNAEIGSHISFERRPNVYERNIYYCMNFFHN